MSSDDDFDDYNDYDYDYDSLDDYGHSDSGGSEQYDDSTNSESSEDASICEEPEDIGDIQDSESSESTEVLGEPGDLSGSDESDSFELTMPTDNFGNEFTYRGSGTNKDVCDEIRRGSYRVVSVALTSYSRVITGAVETLALQPRTRTLTIIPTSMCF